MREHLIDVKTKEGFLKCEKSGKASGALPLGMLTAFAAEHDNRVIVVVENTTFTDASALWTGVLVKEWVELKADSTMMSCVVDALSANGYTQRGAESRKLTVLLFLAADRCLTGWVCSTIGLPMKASVRSRLQTESLPQAAKSVSCTQRQATERILAEAGAITIKQ